MSEMDSGKEGYRGWADALKGENKRASNARYTVVRMNLRKQRKKEPERERRN